MALPPSTSISTTKTKYKRKDQKRQVYLDAQDQADLRLCQQHYAIGSKPEPYSRLARRLLSEFADKPPARGTELRPIEGDTTLFHFVLDQEALDLLDKAADQFPLATSTTSVNSSSSADHPVQRSSGRPPKRNVSQSDVLRYLISEKARQIRRT